MIAIADEATLFISDQPWIALSNESLPYTLKVFRVKHAASFGTIDQLCVLCRGLGLFHVHYKILVISDDAIKVGLLQLDL